jgi:PBSX family phage terminase large subunit
VSLSDKQADLVLDSVDSTAPIILSNGAVSAGKTWATNLGWAAYVATAPPGPLAMIGKTHDTLERNVLDPLTDQLPPGSVVHTRGANTATILGRLVHVLGANDKKAETKIRGITLAGAYVDEATLLPPGYWDMLLTRLRVPGARLFATTNPDNPRHPLKLEVINKADELGYIVHSFTMDDNPGLDPEYVERMKRSFTGLFYKRFILGLWVAASGAIYDMLDLDGDQAPHRVTPNGITLDTTRARLGIDYGTANATHAVLLIPGTRRSDGREGLVVAGEWCYSGRDTGRALTDPEQSARLRAWLEAGAKVKAWSKARRDVAPVHQIEAARWNVDPSAASFKAQLRRDGVTGVREANNSVVDGLRLVGSLLALDRLWFLDGAAPVLEGQLQGYVWDDDPAVDAPADKQEDHGCDGLRYAVQGSRDVWRPWLTDRDDQAGPATVEPSAPARAMDRHRRPVVPA